MQLIDTRIGGADEGMVKVEFLGEGGELVSVTMTAGDDLRGDAAINRAKAMMVQLTAFAEDRDASQGALSKSSDDGEKSGSGSSGAKPERPVVSSYDDAPSQPPETDDA
ncbi:hypothetical protein [Rhizobium sp. Root1220]|uniref:hypothetical protein n=1 Tax=Rhizobium sp. Root1220 TaxID=1736432 RepID=UPI000AEBA902|nr:hypothetical protein [Rhizobium sp. Root1220]